MLLRENKLTPGMPVIAISAAAMGHDLERIRQAGFDDSLSKPFNIREVPAFLSRHLD